MGASNETASPATLQGPTLPLLTVWQDTDLSRSPALHMAVDEALLRTTSGPVLRFYEWDAPAVTIGYFQEWQAQPGLPDERIVRRWTGGGRVEHGEDSTFSLVLPADSRLAKASADTRYRVIHEALAAALNAAANGSSRGVPTLPRPSCAGSPGGVTAVNFRNTREPGRLRVL